MKRVNEVNAALLVAALILGAVLTGAVSKRAPLDDRDGDVRTVEDAAGERIAVREYARIVSTSTIADQVLIEIIEPNRLLAVSGHTLRTQESRAYQDKIGVERARDIETIIELRPDIVFINNFIDRRQVERLKDAGLNVFDLGEMRGLETLLPNIRQLAAVLDVPGRGEELANDLVRKLDAVSEDIAAEDRRRGLYVGIHGDRLYGGTAGTSFHDVLVAGGVIDMAAEAGFHGWPAFTNEQLLSLDPPWIITNPGTERSLCRHPGFQSLSACRSGQVRSTETHLLTDPGLGILQAAEADRRRGLYVGVHGDRLYGGTAGTSFHDVLAAGGLIDVAAEAGFQGWPAYTNEQLLSLDPPWVITNPGTEQSFCRHPGFQSLSACRAGQVRSVQTHLLTDPGLGIVQAAEAVHAAVYGDGI